MRDLSKLLDWQYMIFLLPCGISAFLLLLSSLRLGHHGGHGHAGHGHVGGHAAHAGAGHAAHGASAGHTHAAAHGAQAHGAHAQNASQSHSHAAQGGKVHADNAGKTEDSGQRPAVNVTTNFIWHLTGADRAPWMMLLEAFFLVWGVVGFWADQTFVATRNPTMPEMALPLGVAFITGIAGARIAAEVIARLMPEDETLVVSQEGLYGLTGTVAFPVTQTAGRIHVYDTYGTLHDETCRVQADHPPIGKGSRAIVVDRDSKGFLIVEEL